MYVCHSIIYLPLHSLLTTVVNWLWLTVLLWLMIDDVIYDTVTIIYQKSTSNSTSSVKLFFKLFRRLNALRPYRTWWLTLLPPESQNPKTPNTINNQGNLKTPKKSEWPNVSDSWTWEQSCLGVRTHNLFYPIIISNN